MSVCSVGLSIDFHAEHLYWISSGNSTINRCKLDGSALEVLDAVKGKLNKASALAIMGKYSPHDISTDLHTNANVGNNNMLAFCCVGDKLWWADQGTDQIGTCDKSDGGNWKVLRNGTSPMMHMKIYNETVQTGVRLRRENKLQLLMVVLFAYAVSSVVAPSLLKELSKSGNMNCAECNLLKSLGSGHCRWSALANCISTVGYI